MATPIATAIGRVQPIFRGDYNSFLPYKKLDNVLYNNATYIALRDVPAGNIPDAPSSTYWQKIAGKGDKGDTGSFGEPTATASGLEYGQDPTVSVTASGPDTAKVFSFEFGLPAGPLPFVDVSATASSLQPNTEPSVTAELVGAGTSKVLSFDFGIPAADGQGAASVDQVLPGGDRNIVLNAVRAIQNQGLSTLQQQYARENINAQVAGDYQPAGDYITDPSASTNQYLYFNNEGNWVGKSINEVPSGSSSDVNKYLRKTASGMIWASVQALPSGGAEGMPLVKNSVDDYDVGWGSTISSAEIDIIINS